MKTKKKNKDKAKLFHTELWIQAMLPVKILAKSKDQINKHLGEIEEEYAKLIKTILPEAKIEVNTPVLLGEEDKDY